METENKKLYGFNRDFLEKHTGIIELKMNSSAILIVPAWQARVMTSTARGDSGFSFGWINHDLISAGELQPHINAFGGEERLWLGPEGGQFSIYFKKGVDFIYDNWQVPDFIDTREYDLVSKDESSATFSCKATFSNYSGFEFDIGIKRKVSILPAKELLEETGINCEGLNLVAYKSENSLVNNGKQTWDKNTGLLSVWMLGMFNPSPAVVVVIPVKQGEEDELGPVVNDDYFGKIPADRLKVKGKYIFFKADGNSRGKIGIPPLRTTGIMGSYDTANGILTLLYCRLPEGVTDYVNSAWQVQDDPFSGDAFNSYNDGPLEDGSRMGPFYELETSSPAAALDPGKSLTHTQYTVHLTGTRDALNRAATGNLGISLDEIEKAFE